MTTAVGHPEMDPFALIAVGSEIDEMFADVLAFEHPKTN